MCFFSLSETQRSSPSWSLSFTMGFVRNPAAFGICVSMSMCQWTRMLVHSGLDFWWVLSFASTEKLWHCGCVCVGEGVEGGERMSIAFSQHFMPSYPHTWLQSFSHPGKSDWFVPVHLTWIPHGPRTRCQVEFISGSLYIGAVEPQRECIIALFWSSAGVWWRNIKDSSASQQQHQHWLVMWWCVNLSRTGENTDVSLVQKLICSQCKNEENKIAAVSCMAHKKEVPGHMNGFLFFLFLKEIHKIGWNSAQKLFNSMVWQTEKSPNKKKRILTPSWTPNQKAKHSKSVLYLLILNCQIFSLRES